MLARSIKNLLYCSAIAAISFASCKKGDTLKTFSEGSYTGRVISTTVQSGNPVQTVLTANIDFSAGNYSMNTIPRDQWPYTDFIPFTGTYDLQADGKAITLTYISLLMPPMIIGPGYVKGKFDISFKADSLILTQNLADGAGYQYRLVKVR